MTAEDNVEKDKTNEQITKRKTFSRWQAKRKIKKLSEFTLSEEENKIIRASDQELKKMLIDEMTEKIEILKNRIEEINRNKDKSESPANKKYLVAKIRKLRKALNDEQALKSRVKLLQLKRRKLNYKKKKIEQKLGILKNSLKRCLKCRKRGHVAAECQMDRDENSQENEMTKSISRNVCYNCGSIEHSLSTCDKPIDYTNLRFAECFKCKGKGHIFANCPLNEKGIYVRGGSCFICKGKDHLAKNCPQKESQNETEMQMSFKEKKKKKTILKRK